MPTVYSQSASEAIRSAAIRSRPSDSALHLQSNRGSIVQQLLHNYSQGSAATELRYRHPITIASSNGTHTSATP
jgi:hypothetical protein